MLLSFVYRCYLDVLCNHLLSSDKATSKSQLLSIHMYHMQDKEAALDLSVNMFCRLVKHHANVDQLLTM